MTDTSVTLTVYFEDPFWVGVFERSDDGQLSVCKVTFGAEPKDYTVQDFILHQYCRLAYGPAVEAGRRKTGGNPKRMQREAKKQTAAKGIGTKSQQALQLLLEDAKKSRKEVSREQRLAEKERQFALRRQKRKEKHRGR